jgi:hypothetical protein
VLEQPVEVDVQPAIRAVLPHGVEVLSDVLEFEHDDAGF